MEATTPDWAGPLAGRLQSNLPLAPFTTLKIGGPAEWYFRASTPEDLVASHTVAREAGIPVTFLGDGSNVLISDTGIRGLVIHNRADKIERNGTTLSAQSGALLSELVERSRTEGLAGLEFAAGIYGSVGGAVYGNAGAYGRAMADVLTKVEILTSEGARRTVDVAQMAFSYRHSGCSQLGWFVLACDVDLQPAEQQSITDEVERIIAIRATKLPVDLPSAGSYFKNIEEPSAEYGKIPAGQLLEQVGAKSMRVGGAGVYEKHANVIVNLGNATASDVLTLASQMKAAVHKRFGRILEAEVRFLGELPTGA